MSRITNAIRCYASYLLTRCGWVGVKHLPLFVSVEPANVCQLHCPECPVSFLSIQERVGSSTPNDRLMRSDVWERILTEVSASAYTLQFYFQGEPLLNPLLPQMIAAAREKGLYTIVSTNAQAMTQVMAEELVKAGLHRIIISMDGLTQQTYSSYRVGGDVERCKDALRWLKQAKQQYRKHTLIELQCLRLRTNEHEWDLFRQHYRSMGADRLVFKTAQLYDYTNGHALMPSDKRYSRYEKGKDGHYHRKSLGKGCFRVWSGCVITTDGTVLPCCYDKTHQYAYGNIMQTDLRTLFTGEKATVFRRAAINQQPPICKECWK